MCNKNEDIIKSNSNGKLWIDTKDFFSCPTVIKLIKELQKSSIVKKIEKNHNKNLG